MALGSMMALVKTDTDPENMLPGDDPVRVLNARMAEQFGSTNSVFIGLIDDDGVATPEFLGATSGLIDELRGTRGVVASGIVSFELAGAAYVAPGSQTEADALADAVDANDLLRGFAIAESGTGLSILIPLEDKSDARRAANTAEEFIDANPVLNGAEAHIAGLPLAEEEFGFQMFLQMGILAPLAGMLIFALMIYFFRKLALVFAAMIVAMVSVIWTMGLLIGLGFSVHIMTSMIPIFLMPIAILDSIHVLSEFIDRYVEIRDRRETLRSVYKDVLVPITYTTLTTAVAFGSLALAPIPPVQVFGSFVAVGVVIAWLMTLVFVPAFVMSLSEEGMERLVRLNGQASNRWFTAGVRRLGGFAIQRALLAPSGFALIALLAIPGVLLITINDNPVRWFKSSSEIRQSTNALNETFGGTYQANLLVRAESADSLLEPEVVDWVDGLEARWSTLDEVGASSTYLDAIRAASPDGELGATPAENAGVLEQVSSSAAAPLVSSLIDTERRNANLQLRLTNGDNTAMQRVVDATESYIVVSPVPDGIGVEWAGETYLNLVWQNKMVSGMLNAFLTTLAVAFVLMILLFRSVRWAVMAIIPLAGSIVLVYGLAGFVGRDYDMPMAVLSTLVLGIGIDFAIHFIQRFRAFRAEHDTVAVTLRVFFEEPARALSRNAVIISLGFVPLLLASLTPYIIVGQLLVSIMALSWLATVVVLPGLVKLLDGWLPKISATVVSGDAFETGMATASPPRDAD